MVKKVKKYLKFVVCCALILSLIAPAYAALSASDGSAFVTKAEFDSAMADFNARLTTFEAGINSKIDSQVTSYLDRNGIWNGATQSRLYGGCNSIIMRFGAQGVVPLLYNISKSGLLHCQIKFKLFFPSPLNDFQRMFAFYCFKDTETFLARVKMRSGNKENRSYKIYNLDGSVQPDPVPYVIVANAGSYADNTAYQFGSKSGDVLTDIEQTSFNGPNDASLISPTNERFVAALVAAGDVKPTSGYIYTSYMTTIKDRSTYDPTDNGTAMQVDFFQFVSKGGCLIGQFGNQVDVMVMADGEVGSNVRQAGFANSADVY